MLCIKKDNISELMLNSIDNSCLLFPEEPLTVKLLRKFR